MTRSDEERFADILDAIDRCQNYEQYLRESFRVNPDLILDIVDQQLGPLAHRLRSL